MVRWRCELQKAMENRTSGTESSARERVIPAAPTKILHPPPANPHPLPRRGWRPRQPRSSHSRQATTPGANATRRWHHPRHPPPPAQTQPVHGRERCPQRSGSTGSDTRRPTAKAQTATDSPEVGGVFWTLLTGPSMGWTPASTGGIAQSPKADRKTGVLLRGTSEDGVPSKCGCKCNGIEKSVPKTAHGGYGNAFLSEFTQAASRSA